MSPADRTGPERAKSVLVVDDDAVVRDLVVDTLLFEGFHVRTAADGVQALEAMEASRPEAVVLDLMMPHMDGIGVLERVRGTSALRSLPILLLTSRDDDLAEFLGWQGGCDAYVMKPFEPSDLVAALREILRTSGEQTSPML